MESNQFRQFSDQLRLQTSSFSNLSISDSIWSKTCEERRNLDVRAGGERSNGSSEVGCQQNNGFITIGWKSSSDHFDGVSSKGVCLMTNNSSNKNEGTKTGKNSIKINDRNNICSSKSGVDRRFKSLPPSECLGRGETIGGYIFVCNNETMQENLQMQLFGLPPRYRDSVRAITPGLPLFLYNYSNHQLHGVFKASSFGGSNIDPKAWENKKVAGESRFPAQVRVITKKLCSPLEEDSFRPILHHYDGPKFRLELSVPEALALLDIFAE